jgi:hypothetical protein
MTTFLISNKGNLTGINSSLENTLEYTTKALEQGFFVVVDVWLVGSSHLALGNYRAENPVTLDFLQNKRVIARARSVQTLQYLIENRVHCFMNGKDDYIMTNGGLIWTSCKDITKKCIIAMPEWSIDDFSTVVNINCAGICSDKIQLIKNHC